MTEILLFCIAPTTCCLHDVQSSSFIGFPGLPTQADDNGVVPDADENDYPFGIQLVAIALHGRHSSSIF
jgi:hypothetical protein